MNPKIELRLRAALSKNYKTFNDNSSSVEDLCKEMKFEDLDLPEDDYLKLCFYETLRIEPPAPWSSSTCLTEDQTIGGVKIAAGDPIFVNIHALHHDEEQWGPDHDQFIPDRFDLSSEYCIKNSPPKRHPMSFLPFNGGKRVCVGKTFAETGFKVVMPIILKAFCKDGKFGEFIEQGNYTQKPDLNALLSERPEILVKIG
jgi:cytochrome P450